MDSTKPEQITTESVREPNDSSGRVAIENLTFDVSEDALGDDVGPDYYRSWQFMGTVIVCLGSILNPPPNPPFRPYSVYQELTYFFLRTF